MSNEKELIYSLAIYRLCALSAKQMFLLKKYFGNFYSAYHATPKQWQEAKISQESSHKFFDNKQTFSPPKYLAELHKKEIIALNLSSFNYPTLLKEIPDPPFFIFCRGNTELLNKHSLAIVGTRRISDYGKQVISRLLPELVANELVIVSGLAYGVDAYTHQITLQEKGQCLAVLGSPIDQIYPRGNNNLAQKILQSSGLIISENAPGTAIQKFHFPMRNRVISGLSLGTLVVEAPNKSGALITATCAVEQNRELFVVPGSIFNPLVEGNNNLIKKGAQPITESSDIIESIYPFKKTTSLHQKTIPYLPSDEIEAIIINNLTRERHLNELSQISEIPIAELTAKLVILELKNVVLNLGNNIYIKK